MAKPWLDMLWKVTVDESSIIYSSAELRYLFFSAAWAARDHGTKQAASRGLFMWLSADSVANPVVEEAVTAALVWCGRCGQDGDSPWLLLTPSLSLPSFLFHVIDQRSQCQLWTSQKQCECLTFLVYSSFFNVGKRPLAAAWINMQLWSMIRFIVIELTVLVS